MSDMENTTDTTATEVDFDDVEQLTEAEFTSMVLAEALFAADDIEGVRNFADSGLLTRNEGLVVRMADGSEFQVTVVRSN